jgi:hypothetical protein
MFRSQPPGEQISLPPNWVPFDADYVSIGEDGKTKLSGRYYRGSDGSWRQDGRTMDGMLTSQIVSIPDQQSYKYDSRGGKWLVQPLAMEPGGPQPPRLRPYVSGYTKVDELHDGLVVYERRDASGIVALDAPALNLFPVVKHWPEGGKFVFTNIQRRHQDSVIFKPPSGVPYERSDRPVSMGKTVHVGKQ